MKNYKIKTKTIEFSIIKPREVCYLIGSSNEELEKKAVKNGQHIGGKMI